MKNLFLFFLLMGISLGTIVKDRIIKNPAFELSNMARAHPAYKEFHTLV